MDFKIDTTNNMLRKMLQYMKLVNAKIRMYKSGQIKMYK